MSVQPTIRQSRNFYLIIQILLLAVYLVIFTAAGTANPLFYAALCCAATILVLHTALTYQYKKGFAYYRRESYLKAIPEFNQCSLRFMKHRYLDLFLSAGKTTYLEKSLVNMAFCYDQLGSAAKAKELYLQALSLFPDSQLAREGLNAHQLLNR